MDQEKPQFRANSIATTQNDTAATTSLVGKRKNGTASTGVLRLIHLTHHTRTLPSFSPLRFLTEVGPPFPSGLPLTATSPHSCNSYSYQTDFSRVFCKE